MILFKNLAGRLARFLPLETTKSKQVLKTIAKEKTVRKASILVPDPNEMEKPGSKNRTVYYDCLHSVAYHHLSHQTNIGVFPKGRFMDELRDTTQKRSSSIVNESLTIGEPRPALPYRMKFTMDQLAAFQTGSDNNPLAEYGCCKKAKRYKLSQIQSHSAKTDKASFNRKFGSAAILTERNNSAGSPKRDPKNTNEKHSRTNYGFLIPTLLLDPIESKTASAGEEKDKSTANNSVTKSDAGKGLNNMSSGKPYARNNSHNRLFHQFYSEKFKMQFREDQTADPLENVVGLAPIRIFPAENRPDSESNVGKINRKETSNATGSKTVKKIFCNTCKECAIVQENIKNIEKYDKKQQKDDKYKEKMLIPKSRENIRYYRKDLEETVPQVSNSDDIYLEQDVVSDIKDALFIDLKNLLDEKPDEITENQKKLICTHNISSSDASSITSAYENLNDVLNTHEGFDIHNCCPRKSQKQSFNLDRLMLDRYLHYGTLNKNNNSINSTELEDGHFPGIYSGNTLQTVEVGATISSNEANKELYSKPGDPGEEDDDGTMFDISKYKINLPDKRYEFFPSLERPFHTIELNRYGPPQIHDFNALFMDSNFIDIDILDDSTNESVSSREILQNLFQTASDNKQTMKIWNYPKKVYKEMQLKDII